MAPPPFSQILQVSLLSLPLFSSPPLREKIPGSPPLELYQYWYVLIQEESLPSFPEILRIS